MAIADLFGDDPTDGRLASYFMELFDYLVEEGVPEDRLPSPWHVLSRVVKAIDQDSLREWLDAYVAVEAEELEDSGDNDDDDDDDDDGEEETYALTSRVERKKRRPTYLRALDSLDSVEPVAPVEKNGETLQKLEHDDDGS